MSNLPYRPTAGLKAIAIATALLASVSAARAHGDHGGGADGSVLPQGVTLVTLQYDVASIKPISDSRLNELAAAGVDGVHALRTIAVPSLALAYGLTKDFTLAARLPYLVNSGIRESSADLGTLVDRGGVRGFGDASMTGTYRFFNDHHSGVEAALIFGVKAPTGRTNVVDSNGELFEAEHQPGSGAWDVSFGGAASKQMGLWSFGINALYTRAGAGSQDTRLGDRLSYGVNASYRLWSDGGGHGGAMHLGADFDGMMHHGGVDHAAAATPAKSIDVSLGLDGRWSGRQTQAGAVDANSGGSALFLTPGARLTVGTWSLFGTVGIAVAQQSNGIQSEPRLQATTGLSVRF